MKTPYIIVLVTTANREEAEKIIQSLLEAKLIACGNIVDRITSTFRWKGSIEKSEECLLFLKSRKDLFKRISNSVRELHSYKVPEIIVFEIVDGSKDYLEWLEDSLN